MSAEAEKYYPEESENMGRRLRSEAVINGRSLKEGHPKFARPGLKKVKEKFGEAPGQKFPKDWAPQAVLPEKYKAT